MNTLLNWLWNILIAIDQGANVVFSPVLNLLLMPKIMFGNPDETLSSVMGKNVRAGSCPVCHFMCRWLSFIQKEHCKKSIEDDEK